MTDRLTCPVCGESNPADMEFCRNCQSRLRPLNGPLKDESDAIQPGELPTKKVTSELEPLLPQWLREARQQARDTAAEDQSKAAQEPKEPATPSVPDLLDGLASQSQDEDEDVPDWLAQITGATSKKKKSASEEQQVKRVELGRDLDVLSPNGAASIPPEIPTARGPEKDELADWFKQAAASSETGDFHMPKTPSAEPPAASVPEQSQPFAEPQRPAQDLSWLRNLGAAEAPPPQVPAESPPAREEAPDWLKKLQAEQAPPPPPPTPSPAAAPQAEVPDWLKQFEESAPPAEPAEPSRPEQPPAEPGVPDWLKGLPAAAAEVQAPETRAAGSEASIPTELPDWMASLGAAQERTKPAEAQPSAEQPVEPVELPDWISSLGTGQELAETPEPQPAASETIPPAELPDWISTLGTEQATPQAAEPERAEPEPAAAESLPPAELPDWISLLGAEQAARPAAESQPAAEEAMSAAELPDWLSSLGAPEPSGEVPEPSALEPELPAAETPAVAHPAAGAALPPQALAGEDVDAVFASMQTPDWLSAVLPSAEESAESAPSAAPTAEEPIAPAELPSWVQAMRPVESVMEPTAGAEEDISTEKRGPLAGLHGVLPSIPGAGEPSSKPKPQSFKLNATEQQVAHAALLERILAAETSPIPMRTGAVLRSQKIVRWFISLLLLLVLGGIVFGGTQFFALPAGVPNETVAAIAAVEAVPADAPVLVVFDYQPATVGEMEAAGGPLLDHLLLLNHPRLALLSTSPTGPALAERFMSTVLGGRGYVRDQQYVNLGYLPGGLAGVYNFAQDPSATVPLDTQLRAAWQSSFLTSVHNFSDFAAVIVLTDSVESGRTWVEQTALARGKSTMVFVASAQAGPMLLPYADSGQVNGMVSGIYGAVGVEQRNAGSPGLVRRYWDAYSMGLYLALVLITLGALWNVWLGIRDRRAQAVQ